jgi:hypothetical protein
LDQKLERDNQAREEHLLAHQVEVVQAVRKKIPAASQVDLPQIKML